VLAWCGVVVVWGVGLWWVWGCGGCGGVGGVVVWGCGGMGGCGGVGLWGCGGLVVWGCGGGGGFPFAFEHSKVCTLCDFGQLQFLEGDLRGELG
jgi:hypothetical protein